MEKPVEASNDRYHQWLSRERVLFAMIMIIMVYVHISRTEEGRLARQLRACCNFLLGCMDPDP